MIGIDERVQNKLKFKLFHFEQALITMFYSFCFHYTLICVKSWQLDISFTLCVQESAYVSR